MSRVQLALNVPDIDEAVAFYSKLFAAEPNKRKPGYANFAIADPPLKLVLFEKADADARLNHLGVEVTSTDEVHAHQARLADRRPRAGRRERHLLLRQAGQGVGRRTRRRLGDLHRARRQRDLRPLVRPRRRQRRLRVLRVVGRVRDILLLMADAKLDRQAVESPRSGGRPTPSMRVRGRTAFSPDERTEIVDAAERAASLGLTTATLTRGTVRVAPADRPDHRMGRAAQPWPRVRAPTRLPHRRAVAGRDRTRLRRARVASGNTGEPERPR